MKDDLVSVIVPNYNNEEYLSECIQSILKQTHSNVEIVIVDDASTDGSVNLIKKLMEANSCMRLVQNQVNKGVTKSKHLAILSSTGSYLTSLDSDDFFIDAEKIEKELEAVLKHGEGAIGFSKIVLVGSDGEPLFPNAKNNIQEGDIFEEVFLRACMIPRDFLFTKDQYFEAGGFDEKIPIYEDWDLKVRLAKRNRFHYSHVDGIAYRRHGSGLSSAKTKEHVKWLKYIYKKNKGLIPGEDRGRFERLFKEFMLNAFGKPKRKFLGIEF